MLSSLQDRLKPIAGELFKFVVVGGFCFVLDTVLSTGLFNAGVGPTTSKTISTIVATAVSYVGNRLWSFAHRVEDDRGHRQDVLVYTAINVVGLLITLVPVEVTHYLFGQKTTLAFALSSIGGTVVATVFRFWAYRRWVFAAQPELAEKAALV